MSYIMDIFLLFVIILICNYTGFSSFIYQESNFTCRFRKNPLIVIILISKYTGSSSFFCLTNVKFHIWYRKNQPVALTLTSSIPSQELDTTIEWSGCFIYFHMYKTIEYYYIRDIWMYHIAVRKQTTDQLFQDKVSMATAFLWPENQFLNLDGCIIVRQTNFGFSVNLFLTLDEMHKASYLKMKLIADILILLWLEISPFPNVYLHYYF